MPEALKVFPTLNSSDSKWVGRYWPLYIEWWVKHENPTTWSRPHYIWNAEFPNNRMFLSTFLANTNPITQQSGHLKCDEISSKWSVFGVWVIILCIRISAFQRTSNQSRTTHMRACDSLFLKMEQNESTKCLSADWTRSEVSLKIEAAKVPFEILSGIFSGSNLPGGKLQSAV